MKNKKKMKPKGPDKITKYLYKRNNLDPLKIKHTIEERELTNEELTKKRRGKKHGKNQFIEKAGKRS